MCIHPFPHITNSTPCIFSSAPTIILMSLQGQSLSIPSPDFLNGCLQPSPRRFICHTHTLPQTSYNIPSCSRALMSSINIHSQCTFDEIPLSPYPFVLSLPDVSILHFFQVTTATIKCHDAPNDTLITGTFVLPHTCQLSTSSITIPATRVLLMSSRLSAPVNTPFSLPPPTFNVTLPRSRLRLLPPPDDIPMLFLDSHHTTFGYPVYITRLGILIVFLSFYIYRKVTIRLLGERIEQGNN
ncbi:uncharacterized protein LOC119580207 [Penaeus monodon]|uniref:uncharacterized protein LOC119580207 n=1 Tax=Penaeus monodon TaxID=6687 RepID=UPI0018A7359B|nr:uncharacterized protein LOC119580207 [Penaeus monodon]